MYAYAGIIDVPVHLCVSVHALATRLGLAPLAAAASLRLLDGLTLDNIVDVLQAS